MKIPATRFRKSPHSLPIWCRCQSGRRFFYTRTFWQFLMMCCMIFIPPVQKLTHHRLQLDPCARTHFLPNVKRCLPLKGQLSQAPDEIFSLLNDADTEFPDALDQSGAHMRHMHFSFPFCNRPTAHCVKCFSIALPCI